MKIQAAGKMSFAPRIPGQAGGRQAGTQMREKNSLTRHHGE